jgi:hypothetical protein
MSKLVIHGLEIVKVNIGYCQLRIKSEPFFVDLRFKSEHLKSDMIFQKRGIISWCNYISGLLMSKSKS